MVVKTENKISHKKKNGLQSLSVICSGNQIVWPMEEWPIEIISKFEFMFMYH